MEFREEFTEKLINLVEENNNMFIMFGFIVSTQLIICNELELVDFDTDYSSADDLALTKRLIKEYGKILNNEKDYLEFAEFVHKRLIEIQNE